jgi:hypothetical protein
VLIFLSLVSEKPGLALAVIMVFMLEFGEFERPEGCKLRVISYRLQVPPHPADSKSRVGRAKQPNGMRLFLFRSAVSLFQ